MENDEWRAKNRMPRPSRGHATINHSAMEWARDGDGVGKVQTNTTEGIWDTP